MKTKLSFLIISGFLFLQTNAIAADDYDRPDNTCGQIHADKSGDDKDAAIARCIQERYKSQRTSGTQEVKEARKKQCNAGAAGSDKDHYMNDCDAKNSPSPSAGKGTQDRQLKKLGKDGLDTSGDTHKGSSNKPASVTNSSGGVNTGKSDSPFKESR